MITLIAAISENRVIGADNQLLWHLPNDFKFFKEKTLNQTVLMGRKTWESLPIKPLPNRLNLVLSSQTLSLPDGAKAVESIQQAQTYASNLMIIGGGQLYEQMLSVADVMYLTRVNVEVQGDVYFPQWNDHEWTLIWQEFHEADEKHAYGYAFECYKRCVVK